MSNVSDQKVGAVETRGIEPVPGDERRGNPLQLFWVWFAANISILALPLGATLVALRGLNIWQAVLVGAVGSVGSFALVGLISVAGKWGGAPSMTLSRAVFGPRGNRGPTLVSWLSRVGWEVVLGGSATPPLCGCSRGRRTSSAASTFVTGLLFTVAETSDTDVWFAGPFSRTWPARTASRTAS
jgi:purine-cytosine permease-like protein